jgi:hypothetical protein
VTPTPTPQSLGCTPGFWQGGAGIQLWNDPPQDPQWVAAHFVYDQPYQTVTQFNSFFTPYTPFGTKRMIDFVGSGGGGNDATKAARDVVAGYLNASRFGDLYPYSRDDIEDMWADAVANPIGPNGFKQLHTILGPANELGCPGVSVRSASLPAAPSWARVWSVFADLRLFAQGGTRPLNR